MTGPAAPEPRGAEREALVRTLMQERITYREQTAEKVADTILASSWLQRHDAAVAAEARREAWDQGWNEGVRVAWRHARWFEPHEAIPVPGSEVPRVRSTRMPGGKCATCGEALNGWHRASPLLPRAAAPPRPDMQQGDGDG